ncbi:MAG: magnesium transporter [Proteobacteria bacterium]|nr:magnesium transporter [Pseudomonadota bacterium]
MKMDRKTSQKLPGSLTIEGLLRRDFPAVYENTTVEQVFQKFREAGLQHKIIYLYVLDAEDKLLGVLPLRRLLVAEPASSVKNIYLKNCMTLTPETSLSQAKKAFSKHKFLAFPVVDSLGKFQGVLDIESFAGDLGDVSARRNFNDIYDLFGVHWDRDNQTSGWMMFLNRIPWLGATFLSGMACAFLTGQFEHTLQGAIVFACFLTLILGLNESVSMQSATLTVQKLHDSLPNFRNLLLALQNEFIPALGIALSCGVAAAFVSYIWKGVSSVSLALGLSLFVSLIASCIWGVIVPFTLHRASRDPRFASGPLVLAFTDLTTLLIYFSCASRLLNV